MVAFNFASEVSASIIWDNGGLQSKAWTRFDLNADLGKNNFFKLVSFNGLAKLSLLNVKNFVNTHKGRCLQKG